MDLIQSEPRNSNGNLLMSKSGIHADHDKIDLPQIISLILSVYILGALIVQTLFPLSPETTDLLDKVDFFICLFFLYDFFVRFYKAKSKLQFLKWGWIDFISSIPVLGVFQWARIARVVRIIRILRAFRSTKILIQYLFRNRSRGTLATAVLISILMMIFSSIAILNFENAPDSNIKNAEDALWWAFTTITTVGYGDKYPVTTEGRIVAALLMTSSVGLFGIFTGFIASFFVAEDQKKDDAIIKALIEEVRLLRLKIELLAVPTKDANVPSDETEKEMTKKPEIH
jgi:voltage-gated potassium channel